MIGIDTLGNDTLVQVFATVLTGVFIFLTVEKRSLFWDDLEARMLEMYQQDKERKEMNVKINALYNQINRKIKESKSHLDQKLLEEIKDATQLFNSEAERIRKVAEEKLRLAAMRDRYINLTTMEGRVTIFMILLLSSSVIWII